MQEQQKVRYLWSSFGKGSCGDILHVFCIGVLVEVCMYGIRSIGPLVARGNVFI